VVIVTLLLTSTEVSEVGVVAVAALNAKSVGLYPSGLSDDAEAEFFLDDVTVEGPACRRVQI